MVIFENFWKITTISVPKYTFFLNFFIDHQIKTNTSQKENEYPWNENFKLVDIPGHSRVRQQCLSKFLSTTRALLFLIDTETVRDDIRDSAEYLVSLMSNPILYSRTSTKYKLPILIACNKQDHAMAKSASAIRKMLETEIDILKTSHKQTLKTTAVLDNEADELDIAKKNAADIFFTTEKFNFDDLSNFTVEFVPISCVEENDAYSFSQVQNWVNKVTKISE